MSIERRAIRRRVSQGRRIAIALAIGIATLTSIAPAHAQLPSVLYTWDNTGNAAPSVENWAKNFGANTVTLDNSIFGELRIIESGGAGADVAISDGANRVRESSTAASGGTDVTGLDYLEFDLGHNGAGPINVQFFVQASTGFTYVSLGPDLPVLPGVNTYQLPLTGLTPAQAVYLRTVGFNARSHSADVTWTLREVRTGGTPLVIRDLITHDAGTPEGGLQGAIVNFDNAAVQGNNGGQNQTGLAHNASGSGSLQWTDLGGSNGAAIGWGNGTAWNNNTFNNRPTDLSGYTHMVVRMSALDATNPNGTQLVQGYFQKDNFVFDAADTLSLPTDGQFHDLWFPIANLSNPGTMNVVDLTGINLAAHQNDLIINVDNIRFVTIPEPGAALLAGLGLAAAIGVKGRRRAA
jgi:hypothetical protein